jgi:hypothetical protein
VTVEGLIAECDEAMALARELRNPTAMVAAIKEKGVLSGKRVEQRESGALAILIGLRMPVPKS